MFRPNPISAEHNVFFVSSAWLWCCRGWRARRVSGRGVRSAGRDQHTPGLDRRIWIGGRVFYFVGYSTTQKWSLGTTPSAWADHQRPGVQCCEKIAPTPSQRLRLIAMGRSLDLAPPRRREQSAISIGLLNGARAPSSIARTVTHPRNLQREAATLSARRDARAENHLVFGVSLRLALLS
jgi:hypothetical protein